MEKKITNKELKQELIKVGYPTDEKVDAIKRKLIELDRKGSFFSYVETRMQMVR